jgi:hypothetical protein
MKFIIEKTNGQYWDNDNDCWTSVKFVATKFEVDDLPFEIDGLELDGEYPEYRYYETDDEEPTAGVILVK